MCKREGGGELVMSDTYFSFLLKKKQNTSVLRGGKDASFFLFLEI